MCGLLNYTVMENGELRVNSVRYWRLFEKNILCLPRVMDISYALLIDVLGMVYRICRQIIDFFRGQTPADAEYNYLDKAKRLEMYGVDLHNARVRMD